MRHLLTLSLSVLFMLSVGGCWTQFDPPSPANDDDTTGDDDDTTGDDDDTTGDDDDTTGDDDDTTGDDDDTTGDDDDTAGDDDDTTGPPVCSEAGVILCGQDFPSNNSASGSTQQVLNYGCSGLEFTGPEYALRWEATQSDPVTVTMSGLNASADLDLFVLEDTGSGCDPTSCVTSANGTDSTESVEFTPVLGQTYYFVADGFSGGISDFTINLDCNPAPGDDDDDTSAGDDDDSAVDCMDPVQIVPSVAMTDSSGQPTTTLSPGNPLTLSVSIENQGGDSGITNFVYPTGCIFSWSLWYANGNPVTGGPTCSTALTFQDYTCGSAPVTGSDVVIPIEGVSGNPVPAGTYDLQVDTIHFGLFNYSVTVP